MNYIKLYLRFVIVYMKGKMEYHCALLLELIANTILIGIYFASFYVIFHNFENIMGWSKHEVLFMFTTSWLSYSFSCFFFWKPMKDIGELVRTGKFDLYLTRPISPLIYLVLQQFQYTFLPRLLFSIGFWVYSMKKLEINWTVANVCYYCICLVTAFVIFSAITIITGAVSFWTIKSEEIVSLLTDNNYGLKNFCDYPLEIYGKGMQSLLIFIVPFAFTGYFPAARLLEKKVLYQQISNFSPVIALVMAVLAYVLWHRGLKHYGSSGA